MAVWYRAKGRDTKDPCTFASAMVKRGIQASLTQDTDHPPLPSGPSENCLGSWCIVLFVCATSRSLDSSVSCIPKVHCFLPFPWMTVMCRRKKTTSSFAATVCFSKEVQITEFVGWPMSEWGVPLWVGEAAVVWVIHFLETTLRLQACCGAPPSFKALLNQQTFVCLPSREQVTELEV